MDAYKFKKTEIIGKQLIIVENSIIVKKDNDIFCQGVNRKIRFDIFEKLLKNKKIEKIELISENLERIENYVIEPKSFKDRKKLLNKAKQIFKYINPNPLETLYKWIFLTKGSASVNIGGEKKYQEKRLKNNIDNDSRNKIKAKFGSPYKNRSTRQTPISNEEKWKNDKTTLLPNGIRKSDQCSFQMNNLIFDKLITEFISIKNCPENIKSFFEENGYYSGEIHLDYLTRHPIKWEMFEKNTHHSKIKGLEFCHINPTLDFPTIVSNVTIGTCESNRKQGGYSLIDKWSTLTRWFLYENNPFITEKYDIDTIQKMSNKELILELYESINMNHSQIDKDKIENKK